MLSHPSGVLRRSARNRQSGLTLIELTVALAILVTVGMAFLTIMSQTMVLAREGAERRKALEIAIERTEDMLALGASVDNQDLYNAWHNPPEIVVEDSDGDDDFDTGLARIVVREEFSQLDGGFPLVVELVVFRAEK